MKSSGFTLAELLIALTILGVIATFTIPKVLYSQQSSQYNAAAKEAAGSISQAFTQLQMQGTISSSTTPGLLIPYLNYIKVQTSGLIDNQYTQGSYDCSWNPCYLLHNGGTLVPLNNASFAGTSSTNAIWFIFDPDGKYGGNTVGSSKSIDFAIYYNGRLRTTGSMFPNTVSSDTVRNPDASLDPPWFSW